MTTNLSTRMGFSPFDVLFKNFLDSDSIFAPAVEIKFKYPVDIQETNKGLQFDIAVPGLDEKDLQIEITDGNTLNVSYKKYDAPKETVEDNYLYKGIAKRSFSFGWKIDNKYDLTKIEAFMKNGLLSIHIPISPESKPRIVTINTIK
jgi:HSP20 family protein